MKAREYYFISNSSLVCHAVWYRCNRTQKGNAVVTGFHWISASSATSMWCNAMRSACTHQFGNETKTRGDWLQIQSYAKNTKSCYYSLFTRKILYKLSSSSPCLNTKVFEIYVSCCVY